MKNVILTLKNWVRGLLTPKQAARTEPEKERMSEKESRTTRLSRQVNRFLTERYDFRYNLLTAEVEFRPQGERTVAFLPIGKRNLNTFCIEAHEAGIACWDKDIVRFVQSTFVEEFHPFYLYMEELPAWDGVDRIDELARRVSDDAVWTSGFHTWLLGLASQWMGRASLHANSVAPLLVSREQGLQKSTFCRSLMPPTLMRYYADNLKLTSMEQSERLLAEMGLLNMDEFDKYAETRMPLLKNLMQMTTLNIRKAYQQNYRVLPRIASFIGTSNRFDLLTDPTGSRRFLCIEVTHSIDCTGIDHDQLFAQLKAELQEGRRHWFTHEEEAVIQQHNRAFRRLTPLDDLILSHYRTPDKGERCLQLTSAEIYAELQKEHPALLRGSSPMGFGRALLRAGLQQVHTVYGNVYEVVRLEERSIARRAA